jgi:PAS domain-containing protein
MNVTGMPVRAFGVIRDITARKQSEELLRRQADLLDQSHDAIFTWKIDGGIVYWNRGAAVLYGYTAEDAIERRLIPIDAIKAATTKPEEPKAPEHPCPCCGGRMRIIEIFFAGQQPRHRPTPLPPKIRIDTS